MTHQIKRKRSVSPVQHIPRPANPFIIFRSDKLKNSIPKSTPGGCSRQKQKDISRETAAAWKSIDPVLKQLYVIQANIIKGEHAKKYPGWVYRPKAAKKSKERRVVVDDSDADDHPTKRAKGEAVITHSTGDTTPIEIVWDSSWFSGNASMTDPFYSMPLQPLVSSSLVPPPMAPTRFGMVSNFHSVPSMHDSNPGLENDGSHNLDSLTGDGLTPASEPPTHGLAQNSDLTYEGLFDGLWYVDDWELALNPELDPSSALGC